MKGLFLLERRTGKRCGHVRGDDLARGRDALPALALLVHERGVKSGSRIWPRKPMVTHSSPSTSKRYTGVEYTLSALGFLTPSKSAIF